MIDDHAHEFQAFTTEQLEKLATNRLICVMRIITAKISYVSCHYGWRCCEMCYQYIGNDYDKDVGQYLKPLKEYKDQIKGILSTREDLGEAKPKWRRRRKRHRSPKLHRGREEKGIK